MSQRATNSVARYFLLSTCLFCTLGKFSLRRCTHYYKRLKHVKWKPGLFIYNTQKEKVYISRTYLQTHYQKSTKGNVENICVYCIHWSIHQYFRRLKTPMLTPHHHTIVLNGWKLYYAGSQKLPHDTSFFYPDSMLTYLYWTTTGGLVVAFSPAPTAYVRWKLTVTLQM